MAAVFKQEAHKLIDALPDTAGWEELAEQVETILDIEAGLADSAAGRATDNAQVQYVYRHRTISERLVGVMTCPKRNASNTR